MINEEQKQRFTLTLLVSIFVLAIITVAIAFTALILHILIHIHIVSPIYSSIRFSTIFLLVLPISMVIGFLITMLTSKISLRPVNRLIDQLDRLAHGDFSARIQFGKPISAHSVFQEIEASFNNTAEELEHTEILRNNFLNDFSHEFKTPIMSIAGFAKLLRQDNLSEEKRNEYLAIIEEESLRLSDITTNILYLTRVENQTILKDITSFNLSEQIRSTMLLLTDRWSKKELTLDLELDEYMVEANAELLREVWVNLLDNAIKFSDLGAPLSVHIHDEDEMLVVSISNQGKELPEDNSERIYQKFYQGDESHALEGNGIGLAIVKEIIRLHDGTIEAHSSCCITTFTVHLPMKQKK